MTSKAMKSVRSYSSFIRRSQGLPGHVFGPLVYEKSSWPELLGQGAGDAVKKIREEMPTAKVELLSPPCAYSLEFKEDRVRLIVDGSGKVIRTPEVG